MGGSVSMALAWCSAPTTFIHTTVTTAGCATATRTYIQDAISDSVEGIQVVPFRACAAARTVGPAGGGGRQRPETGGGGGGGRGDWGAGAGAVIAAVNAAAIATGSRGRS